MRPMSRRVHVVGTVGGGREQAMKLLADELPMELGTMPDGEHDRPNWVIEMLEERATRPQFRILRRSRMSDPHPLRLLLDPPRCIPRRGHPVTAGSLELPYAADAVRSWPLFEQFAPMGVRPQYGIPDPRNVGWFFWANPPAHYDVEVQAAQIEVSAIRKMTDQAVFQWEGPLQLVGVAKSPRRAQPKIADHMARVACEFIAGCVPGCTWILHPCWGNKEDTPSANPKDVGALVELLNAMVAHWPHDQILDAVHLPLGNRLHPVPTDLTYYLPLVDLTLPPEVGVFAGFVRPGIELEQQQIALDHATVTVRRGDIGVSTPCGWGRQPGAARRTARLLAAVAAL